MYCNNFYEQSNVDKMIYYDALSHMPPVTFEDVHIGIKNLAYQKAKNLQCIKLDEMLKWTRKDTHTRINHMFDNALQHDMPYV